MFFLIIINSIENIFKQVVQEGNARSPESRYAHQFQKRFIGKCKAMTLMY